MELENQHLAFIVVILQARFITDVEEDRYIISEYLPPSCYLHSRAAWQPLNQGMKVNFTSNGTN